MTDPNYPSPVSELLTLGDCRKLRSWPDYLALGLGPEHIPDLIRMALASSTIPTPFQGCAQVAQQR